MERLGIAERRIYQLVAARRLVSIGSGHLRKITMESLEKECSRRNPALANAKHKQPSEIVTNHDISDSELHKSSLYEKTNSPDNICVVPVSTPASSRANGAGSPIGELVPIARAARLVGLSNALMARVIRDGSVPSVQVGTRRRVNVDALRRWAGSPEGR